MKDDADAVLIDVRTTAEWAFVGVPHLGELGREAVLIEWVEFPDMSPNQNFVEAAKQAAPNPGAPVFFLCRSGQRSAMAARAMTDAGYAKAYNVSGGFEGDKNQDGHRATLNGWKVAGLPWVQN